MEQKSNCVLNDNLIQKKSSNTYFQSFKNLFLFALIILLSSTALLSQAPSHDPSTMIRNTDGRYWIFTTGQGIWCMSSSNSNFTDWRAEPTPFGNTWPSWISNYVTGFTGSFWAPDVVKIGSTYYLYYSCAGEGAPAAIGLATATNLTGPWTDQGMIVAANNAIDPAILIDGSNMWMTWGNWQTGIDICQLSMSTGKRLNSTTTHLVDGQVEGPGITKNGNYYYLFYQRGLCCNGVNSTYYMVVARSTSVTGPYTGERTFLANKSGNIIGPGHFGYGEGKLTYHYYDGNDNGNAKLMITTLGWTSDGWPIAGGTSSAQILANGTYKLKNRANGKYLDNLGQTTDGAEVGQWSSSTSNNQRWAITYSGGFYKVRCISSGKYLDNISHTADGSTVGQLASSTGINQQWTLSAEGTYYKLINRSNGKNVDTGGSTSNGTAMQFWNNNPNFNQQWTLELISTSTARTAEEAEEVANFSEDPDFMVSPIPSDGYLNLDLPADFKDGGNVNIYNTDNRKVFSTTINQRKSSINISTLPSGFYLLMVENNMRKLVKKVIKKQ
jgi:arabinan endo-1,5-alpha-L-arabinosidase